MKNTTKMDRSESALTQIQISICSGRESPLRRRSEQEMNGEGYPLFFIKDL